MFLAQGQIYAKMWLFMCLLVVLGSQGIVVKCTATIFFRMVDCVIQVIPYHKSKLYVEQLKTINSTF